MQALQDKHGEIARMRAHLEKCANYASRNSGASTSSSIIQICENDSSDDGKKVNKCIYLSIKLSICL